MPSPDPHSPILVGAAQSSWRNETTPDPISMMADVLSAAAADAGAGGALLERLQSIAAVESVSRRWPDPAALVAEQLGVSPAETVRSSLGGDAPLQLLGDLGADIAAGRLDCGAIVGAEALATMAAALKQGTEPAGWPELDPARRPSRVLGQARPGSSDAENAVGLIAPLMMYPLFEQALWARDAPELRRPDYQLRLGRLAARFSEVAQSNPYAWSPGPLTAEQIGTASPGNRQVTLPYTKLLNANIQTDQAAALIVCSVEAARALGIASERWVFLHSLAGAHDHWHVSERLHLHSSPAIRLAGRAALSQAGTEIDELAVLDIYSCFPSAVQIGARELGIDPFTDERPLTVTGGLTFAGGPGNNYVTHSLASIVDRLRERPGELGLVSAVGWYLTKHAIAVLGARPPRSPGFAPVSVQREVDALPARSVAPDHRGPVTGESACVIYERDGSPSMAMITGLSADGRRVLSSSNSAGLLAAIVDRPIAGAALAIDPSGAPVLLEGL